MITSVGPRITPMFTGNSHKVNKPSTVNDRDMSIERQIRKKMVEDYCERNSEKIALRNASNRTKLEPDEAWAQADGHTRIGELVQRCGNDLDKIDKEYGYHGLLTYIELADKKPEETLPIAGEMGDFLLRNCNGGKMVSENKIYRNFGDYGMKLLDGVFNLYINETVPPILDMDKNYYRMNREQWEHLRISTIARCAR